MRVGSGVRRASVRPWPPRWPPAGAPQRRWPAGCGPAPRNGVSGGLRKNQASHPQDTQRSRDPSDQKETVKKTISDVFPGHSNRVQTKLARRNSRHFSCTFAHLQEQEFFWNQIESRLLPMLEGVPDLTLRALNEATLASGRGPGRTRSRPECSRPSVPVTKARLQVVSGS
jgi:hypothetical protein